jgi:hypothetical protein
VIEDVEHGGILPADRHGTSIWVHA